MKIGFSKRNYFCVKDFFSYVYTINGCKNKFEDNNGKLCSLSRKRSFQENLFSSRLDSRVLTESVTYLTDENIVKSSPLISQIILLLNQS